MNIGLFICRYTVLFGRSISVIRPETEKKKLVKEEEKVRTRTWGESEIKGRGGKKNFNFFIISNNLIN